MVQRHSSFEHRLLGDARPDDLEQMMGDVAEDQRMHVLRQERRRLLIWQRDPEAVTRSMIAAQWPQVRTVRLKTSGVLVTYGELNALPDYFADADAIDTASKRVVLPIVQTIRQQEFNRLTDMVRARRLEGIGMSQRSVPDHRRFDGAVGPAGATGTIASIQEVSALDDLTEDQGGGVDQYSALLARNADHFAPYSWHRWEQFHTRARDLAQRGFEGDDSEKVRQAWVNNGYADHFLQDSFAAGHLINKTLIMQWYVSWLEANNRRLSNWWRIRMMTADRQPGIAGSHLYGSGSRRANQSTDPQTAQEQPTQGARAAASGVTASGGFTRQEAYQNYLAFLNSSGIQLASGAVHDYFNEHSLMVSSPRDSRAYEIWGDETLLKGGEGAVYAGETAQSSQQAIDDLVRRGRTSIATADIRGRFPSYVHAGQRRMSLVSWHDELRSLCDDEIFPDVWGRTVDFFSSTMGQVSPDQQPATELDDDDVRAEVTRLGDDGVGALPVSERIEMVLGLVSGRTLDADELTILSVLRASRIQGDLVTVVDAVGAWVLVDNTHGDEYDSLRDLLREAYYDKTSRLTALRLIQKCLMQGREWEEEMIADILTARAGADGRRIIGRIGEIYKAGGFAEGLDFLQWRLDGEDQSRVDAVYAQ